MPTQVFNPLGFHCATNAATPDYVIYTDFRQWLAYGLLTCWLSHDADDPNADCSFSRPWDRDDVDELRGYFLDLVETLVVALWKGDYKPGDGEIQGDWESVIVYPEDDESGSGDDTFVTWYVRLDDDAIMLDLQVTGSDAQAIWLSYEALADRQKVAQALAEARATISDNQSYPPLLELANAN